MRKHDENKAGLCEIVLAECRLENLIKSDKCRGIEDRILCTAFVDACDVFPVSDQASLGEIMDVVVRFMNSVETQHEKLVNWSIRLNVGSCRAELACTHRFESYLLFEVGL